TMDLGTPGTWTAVTPTGTAPAPRSSMLAAVDATGDRCVITGGVGAGGGLLSDTWTIPLAGFSAWSPLPTSGAAASGPLARAWDRSRRQRVCLQTRDGLGVRSLDAASGTWTREASTGVPPRFDVFEKDSSEVLAAGVAFDPARDAVEFVSAGTGTPRFFPQS